MSVQSFGKLMQLVGPAITYQNTNMRLAIPPEERLGVTLRYLATGSSFNTLSYNFLMGATTVRKVVMSKCKHIWNTLQPLYMPERNEEDWLKIADQFYQCTNFPNIIGALDGKHIRIIQTDNTGSKYFNYKKYFSQVLMAWVDSDYQFVYIDVVSYGAASDSSVFLSSNMRKRLKKIY